MAALHAELRPHLLRRIIKVLLLCCLQLSLGCLRAAIPYRSCSGRHLALRAQLRAHLLQHTIKVLPFCCLRLAVACWRAEAPELSSAGQQARSQCTSSCGRTCYAA